MTTYMAEWKLRGYVPDSEEEEESQDLSHVGREEKADSDLLLDTGDDEGPLQDASALNEANDRVPLPDKDLDLASALGGTSEVQLTTTVTGKDDELQDATANGNLEDLKDADMLDIDELQEDHYRHKTIPVHPTSLQEDKEQVSSAIDVWDGPRRQPTPALEEEMAHDAWARLSQDASLPPSHPTSPSPAAAFVEAVRLPPPLNEANRNLPSLSSNRESTHIEGQFTDAHELCQPSPNVQGHSARSFRPRKAIQLHPFMIEGEKYRKILHDRGMKAVRIVRGEPSITDNVDAQSSDHEGSQFAGSSSSEAPLSPLASPIIEPREDPQEDDEFPDMDMLLRQQNGQSISYGYKRRRLDRPLFKPPPKLARTPPTIPRSNDPAHLSHLGVGHGNYLSPPPSSPVRDAVNPTHNPVSRGKGVQSKPLPTPTPSSQSAAPFSGAGQKGEASQTEIESDESSDESSDVSRNASAEEADPMRHVQRKIRGVLPASWLKLDIRARGTTSNASRQPYANNLAERKQSTKGVAHPVTKTTAMKSKYKASRDEPFLVSDESSSDDDVQTTFPDPPRPQPETIELPSENRWGEAEEADEVDAMLPAATRTSFKRRSRKRQTNMFEFGVENGKPGRMSSKPHRKPRRSIGATLAPRKAFKKAPKLSILDLQSDEDANQRPRVPPFLKIACRTVRRRHDKGIHSPSRKVIKMATAEDTRDANMNLSNWKNGTIAPKLSRRDARQPLRPPLLPLTDSGNGASRALQSPDAKEIHKQIAIKRHQRTLKPNEFQPPSINAADSNGKQLNAGPHEVDAQKTSLDRGMNRNRAHNREKLARARDFRPALLESLEDTNNRSHSTNAFQRLLQGESSRDTRTLARGPVWDRFFNMGETDGSPGLYYHHGSPGKAAPDNGLTAERIQPKPKTRRKRRPRRIDPSSTWQEVLDIDPGVNEAPAALPEQAVHGSSHGKSAQQPLMLTGLAPFGTKYTLTFDVMPFSLGTAFHQSSYLGSGGFRRSLLLSDLDLDRRRGFAAFQIEGAAFHWGPWNEVVSTEITSLVGKLTQTLRLNASVDTSREGLEIQCCMAAYISDRLSFLDPIDRVSFLQTCTPLLKSVGAAITATSEGNIASSEEPQENNVMPLKVAQMNLVLVYQLYQISQHDLIPPVVKQELLSTVSDGCVLLGTLISNRVADIERLIKRFRRLSDADLIIHDATAEALVVASHVAANESSLHKAFCNALFDRAIHPSIKYHVESLETGWRTLFTVLPYFEFDAQGVLQTGRRYRKSLNEWSSVKALLDPVLTIYLSNMAGQGPSFNGYCRALFGRCLHLLNDWGWRRCDLIIGVLFDFFARNQLNHLRHEESHGSPTFLDNLSESTTLVPEAQDRCFHLLLKIIGSGIRHLRQLVPERKIRDLTWRLMPNHGRSHPKDQAVRQADLNALRNHHDLLCTLYWASPAKSRPRTGVLRDLVNVEHSHKEACHINIQAWSYLVRYQLSTDEPLANLDPFIEWHDDLLQQLLRQHHLARTEAEEHVRSLSNAQGLLVSPHHLESTISTNQRQIEAIMSDAVACLGRAVQVAGSREMVDKLLSGRLGTVFRIFDAGRPQTSSPIIEVLNTLDSYAQKHQDNLQTTSALDNDDSQDYGNWPDLEVAEVDMPDSASNPTGELHDALRNFLSNCFGADVSPADNLLIKAVNVWVVLSEILVRTGVKSWSDYIGSYGSDCWRNLRATDQKRKYTAYYLAALIDTEKIVLIDEKAYFLRSWFEAIVERESILKFQHKFTNALLNTNRDNELFSNLPFARARSTGRYEMSAKDFSDRRLSMIASLLSNMRTSVDRLSSVQANAAAALLKQEYKELLRHMMATMRRNYQELGQASNVQGAYVDFVHRVVEFLQQYTVHICPVDRFFTDNISFPLPATDPTYVVGQLKNYGLRLQDVHAPKELVVFLQSVSERAATDGQQSYLAEQLSAAMSTNFEDGFALPTLRAFVVKAILPAYIEQALQTTCGWILALPFIRSMTDAFGELLHDLDGCQIKSVQAMKSTLTAYLRSVRGSLAHACIQPILFEKASTLKIIRAYFDAVTKLLPCMDYLMRLGPPDEETIDDVVMLESFASIYLNMEGSIEASRSIAEIQKLDDGNPLLEYPDIRSFASNELRQTLEKNWTCRDGSYFVSRGSYRREIVIDIGLVEEERAELRRTLQDFLKVLGQLPVFGLGDESLVQSSSLRALEELVI